MEALKRVTYLIGSLSPIKAFNFYWDRLGFCGAIQFYRRNGMALKGNKMPTWINNMLSALVAIFWVVAGLVLIAGVTWTFELSIAAEECGEHYHSPYGHWQDPDVTPYMASECWDKAKDGRWLPRYGRHQFHWQNYQDLQ